MSQPQSRGNTNNNRNSSQPRSNGNGRSGPQPSNQPDIRIEAMVEKTDAQGELKTVWVPIGAAWRTEAGDFIGELRAEPTEWKHTAERRIFLRLKQPEGG